MNAELCRLAIWRMEPRPMPELMVSAKRIMTDSWPFRQVYEI